MLNSVGPETRYARAGDIHIAYQVLGEGPVDVVLADQWFTTWTASGMCRLWPSSGAGWRPSAG